MSYADLPMLKVEKKDHVLWISLNNPGTSNSITYEMIDSLVSSLRKAENDPGVRVVVLTGEGKNFCSGGDLKNMQNKSEMFAGEANELRQRYEQGIQQISKAMESFSKPVIAAVNGAAAGAGCDIACMCDIRIGSEKTIMMESFVKVGLVPGDGGSFFLQRIVGFAKAMELTLTGREVNAQEAVNIGLLTKVVPVENLRPEAQALAMQIASLPAAAVQMSKKSVKVAYQHDLNVTLDMLAAYQAISQRTHDHFEALTAISEKRKPKFEGR